MDKISNFRGIFREDEESRAVYSEAAGIGQIVPRAVAVPADAEDVVALVKWAAAAKIPLVPRGSGSSMAGGAIGEGVIVDLSGLRSLGEIDQKEQRVWCGPGVLRDELDAAAHARGLRFPVDPSSGAFCTLGGMAATNAAGARTMRFGAMRNWVEALECVFSDGTCALIRRGAALPEGEFFEQLERQLAEVVREERADPTRHRRVRKESSGYRLWQYALSEDIIDLILGSEGTLALITRLELRLIHLRPDTASLLAAFGSFDSAVAAAEVARKHGANCCELLDRTFLDVARSGGVKVPAPESAEAVLLTELEGTTAEETQARAGELASAFRAAGAVDVALALDATTEEAMWSLRHAASPVLSRLDPSLKSMQLIEDGCVPPERLGDYVTGVRQALAHQGIRGVIFGHAGDAHVHVNPLVDVRDSDWRQRAEHLLAEVTALVARLEGTVSGEHGDGRLRTPLLPQVWPQAALERFALVKNAFDPQGIFNPGVKVPVTDAKAIDRVKYDPSLPALPRAARAALARVERERAYARSRLELLEEADGEEARTTGLA